jgi:hypothetical protein
MKKIIFSFSNQHKDYIIEEKLRTKVYQLSSCKKVLQVIDAWRIDIKNIGSLDELFFEGIECEYMPNLKQVWIWCVFYIKEQEYKKFQTIEESIAYDDRYEEYYDKRWEEAPKAKISIDDWQQLQQKWKQVQKELPQYVIFTLDDSGPTDKIEILGKNELSSEDIQEIKIEHEKYLKYQQARQKYMQCHPDYSDIWRGPQDDEYEADIMKYYEK